MLFDERRQIIDDDHNDAALSFDHPGEQFYVPINEILATQLDPQYFCSSCQLCDVLCAVVSSIHSPKWFFQVRLLPPDMRSSWSLLYVLIAVSIIERCVILHPIDTMLPMASRVFQVSERGCDFSDGRDVIARTKASRKFDVGVAGVSLNDTPAGLRYYQFRRTADRQNFCAGQKFSRPAHLFFPSTPKSTSLAH